MVVFIDNNSARDVLISGLARNMLTKLYLTVEAMTRSFPWFTRVPSPSNCADSPSRSLLLEWKGLKPSSCADALDSILEVCPDLR